MTEGSKIIISIMKEEIRRIISYKKNVVYIVVFLAFASIGPLLFLQPLFQEQAIPAEVTLNLVTKLFTYSYAISLALFITYGLSMDSFISDKQNKALETTLTTQLSINRLWLAKSLALFMISYISIIVLMVCFLICSNLMDPGSIVYVPEPLIWATLLGIFPITCFSAISLTGIGMLISRKFVAVNFIMFITAFLLLFIPSFFMTDFLNISTVHLALIYSGISAVLLSTTLISKRIFLQKERVILNA